MAPDRDNKGRGNVKKYNCRRYNFLLPVIFYFLCISWAQTAIIKKQSKTDYFFGYSSGKLKGQKNYQFSTFGADFNYSFKNNFPFTFQIEPFISYVFSPGKNFQLLEPECLRNEND